MQGLDGLAVGKGDGIDPAHRVNGGDQLARGVLDHCRGCSLVEGRTMGEASSRYPNTRSLSSLCRGLGEEEDRRDAQAS